VAIAERRLNRLETQATVDVADNPRHVRLAPGPGAARWPVLGVLVVRRLGCLFGTIVSLTLLPMAILVVAQGLYFAFILASGVVRVATSHR
jgi:hypothetical protein